MDSQEQTGQGETSSRFFPLSSVRFAHSSAYPSLPNGAKCNKHSDEDKRVRDIKHRPDSKVDKVHDSSSSQYIQEIAGGAADGSAEP
jgi:hypothetical protein